MFFVFSGGRAEQGRVRGEGFQKHGASWLASAICVLPVESWMPQYRRPKNTRAKIEKWLGILLLLYCTSTIVYRTIVVVVLYSTRLTVEYLMKPCVGINQNQIPRVIIIELYIPLGQQTAKRKGATPCVNKSFDFHRIGGKSGCAQIQYVWLGDIPWCRSTFAYLGTSLPQSWCVLWTCAGVGASNMQVR